MRNMEKIKRLLSFLTLVCCLAGSMMQVMAASDETTRVVFENAQNEEPDLYVTKHVQMASEDQTLPENLEFTFVLKLDGKLADRLEYRVFEADGTEVFEKDLFGNKVPFRTDRSGTFRLKPEQTAKFEYVGSGVAYEVTELTKEGWEQIQPSGGAPAAGTVTEKGAWAEFTNTAGGGKGDTELRIQKTVSFPGGFEPPETPNFTFCLVLDGKAYMQEPYTILDMDTGLKADTGTTDSQGRFTLKGGQTAVFSQVPAEVDYEVTEEETEGWRATGETKKAGSTGKSGVTLVNFNNASASFAVTKRMEDNSRPEKDFTFLLTKEDRSVWAGASYYLYDTDGSFVPDDNGDPTVGATDKEGYFTLRPGQAAVFTGIEPGTVYNVSEVGTPDYVQTVPGSAGGYTDKVVSNAVEVLPFVNRPSDGGLTVTKTVVNEDGSAPLEQKEFHFILSKKGPAAAGQKAVYAPVSDAVYSVETGSGQSTYQTDDNGRFSIKANETARFTGLSAGDYQVEEVDVSMEYTPTERIQQKTLSGVEARVDFTFVNQYTTRLFDLYLVKKNHSEETLQGAGFMLYRDALEQNPVQEEPYVTGEDGKITVSGLKTGTYYLVEKEAPAGYQLLANPVVIQVTWEKVSGKDVMKVTVDDRSVTSEDTDEQIYIRQKQTGEERDEVHIGIYNSRGFTLPLTGSTGILGLLFTGILGMLVLLGAFKLLRWSRQNR